MRREIDRSVVGKRVRCVFSGDSYSPIPPGTEGTITFIDDTGTVFVQWDNGSRLGLIPGTDRWEVIS